MELKRTARYEWAKPVRLKKRAKRHVVKGADGKAHYDISYALSYGAQYTVVWSGRSNGKTYSTLKYVLEDCAATGREFVWLRREREDFRRGRAEGLMAGMERDGIIKRLYPESDGVKYSASKSAWYTYVDEVDKSGRHKKLYADRPLGYAAALSEYMHDKGSDIYTRVKWIVLDEFIAPYYLRGEWTFFKNAVSTITRAKSDVRVIMLGNTLNPYNPYFREMGIESAKHIKPGTLSEYTYCGTPLRVVCEYADMTEVDVRADLYAFDGAQGRASMISDGVWEVADYPHLPPLERGVKVKVIRRVYFIVGSDSYAIDWVKYNGRAVVSVHPADIPGADTKEYEKAVIFGMWDADLSPRHFRELPTHVLAPRMRALVNSIISMSQGGEVFFSDNATGEAFRAWLADNRKGFRTGEGS